MSRYHDPDYDEEWNNQSAFWEANARRALKGRRGRQALRDLRDGLLALPEKRLIDGALCTVNPERRRPPAPERPDAWWQEAEIEHFDHLVKRTGEGVCAIGAFLWWMRVKAGEDPQVAFDALPTLDGEDSDIHETAALARDVGRLTYYLGWELAFRNDETYRDLTPEQRYTAFLGWVTEELAA